MELEIKTLPSMRVAAMPHSGPYNEIGPAFRKLAGIAGPAGLFVQPGAMMLGIYKDDPATTPVAALRSAAAIVIGAETPIPVGLVEDHVVAGTFASVTLIGAYSGLPNAWMTLKKTLIPEGGHTLRVAASYEIYRNDPTEVPESALCTEIYVPIA